MVKEHGLSLELEQGPEHPALEQRDGYTGVQADLVFIFTELPWLLGELVGKGKEGRCQKS